MASAELSRRVEKVVGYSLRTEDHPGLVGSRKSVYANIAHHANHKTRRCWLKYQTIADELGVSVRVVQGAVPWLDANGYVARAERKRRRDGTLGASRSPSCHPQDLRRHHPQIRR